MNASQYKNWHLKIDDEKIAWLHFDNEHNKVNILHTEAVKELNLLLDEIKTLNPISPCISKTLRSIGLVAASAIVNDKYSHVPSSITVYVPADA